MSTQVAKRHHYVPQFYLNRFASSELLWAYDLKTGREVTTRSVNLAVEKGYHDFAFPEGLDRGIEPLIGKFEGSQEQIRELLDVVIDFDLVEALVDSPWKLLQAPARAEFMVTDNPVFVADDAPLLVPLDRHRMLMITDRPKDEGKREILTQRRVAEINIDMISDAARWVFGSPRWGSRGAGRAMVTAARAARTA